MKTIIAISAVAMIMGACGNAPEDPKKAAMETNKEMAKENEVKNDIEGDMKFAVWAADASMFEVAAGNLAQQKGMSADVKSLGKHMSDGHTMMLNELKDAAAKKAIALPASMSKDMQDAYDDLAEKTGHDFDEAYAEKMVKSHEKAMDEYQKEADKGNDPDLKKWAASKLSALQQHKQMAETTEAAVDKMDDKKKDKDKDGKK